MISFRRRLWLMVLEKNPIGKRISRLMSSPIRKRNNSLLLCTTRIRTLMILLAKVSLIWRNISRRINWTNLLLRRKSRSSLRRNQQDMWCLKSQARAIKYWNNCWLTKKRRVNRIGKKKKKSDFKRKKQLLMLNSKKRKRNKRTKMLLIKPIVMRKPRPMRMLKRNNKSSKIKREKTRKHKRKSKASKKKKKWSEWRKSSNDSNNRNYRTTVKWIIRVSRDLNHWRNSMSIRSRCETWRADSECPNSSQRTHFRIPLLQRLSRKSADSMHWVPSKNNPAHHSLFSQAFSPTRRRVRDSDTALEEA